jgi:hypothetical protein
MEIEFLPFSKDKLELQRDLFRLSFPEAINTSVDTLEHYHWKFHSPFNELSSKEYIAQTEQLMAGYYAAIPYQYRYQDKTFNAGMVCDVMTHPEMRGKGVFTNIGRFSVGQMQEEGLDFLTGYPIRPEVIPGHIKVGWKIGIDLPMFLCPIKSKDILASKGIGFLAPIVDIFLKVIHTTLSLFVNNSQIECKTLPIEKMLDDPLLYKFIERWQNEVPCALIKSKAFLKWRFSAPDTKYLISMTINNQEITSVAITRTTNLKGVQTLSVMDLMGIKEHSRDTKVLLAHLKGLCLKEKAQVIAGVCSNHWFKSYKLMGLLFLKTPIVFKFIYKVLNLKEDEESFFHEKNWHLMWIDCDDL